MNFKKIEFKGGSRKIWAILVFFARHIIFGCFSAVLLAVVFGVFIFYSNITLVNQDNLESMDNSLDIKRSYYDQIIKSWSDEGKKKEDARSFTNIFFNAPRPAPEKPSPTPEKPKPSQSPEETL